MKDKLLRLEIARDILYEIFINPEKDEELEKIIASLEAMIKDITKIVNQNELSLLEAWKRSNQ